jgi:hypothetical protein
MEGVTVKIRISNHQGSSNETTTLPIVSDLLLQIRQQQEQFEAEKAKIIKEVVPSKYLISDTKQYEDKLKSQREDFEKERQQWIKQNDLSQQLEDDEEWLALQREEDQTVTN